MNQESLNDQLRLQSAALEAAANGVVITRRDGAILWVNSAFTQMTGYTADEIYGKNPHILSSGLHDAAFFQDLWQTILEKKVWHGEVWNKRKDGTIYLEEQTVAPVLDEHQEVSHFVAIKQDITERKAQQEALIARNTQLSTLNRVMQTLTASLDLQQVLPSILRELRHVVPYDSASVFQRNGHLFTLIAGEGFTDNEGLIGFTIDTLRDHSPNSIVVQTRQPHILYDAPAEYPLFRQGLHGLTLIRGWMGVPMIAGGRIIGMISIDKYEPGFYTDDHAQMAMAFAAQAAIAVDNAHLYEEIQQELAERTRAETELRHANEQLQIKLAEIEALQIQLREQAIRDSLTGLFNRRYLEETLDREISRALREQTALSVVMIDIDRFKRFNDSYGHRAGDRLLQALGEMLRAQTRTGDVACRYGGEEFIIVLPSAQLAAAIQRAERWRSIFESLRITVGDTSVGTTLSLGVASFPDHGATTESLLLAVDQALYAAKNRGRNRVISFGTLHEKAFSP